MRVGDDFWTMARMGMTFTDKSDLKEQMATPGNYFDPITGDLKDERLELALEEGHDADIPTNIGVYESPEDKERGVEAVKVEPTDQNVVWWDEPEDQDQANPLNWPEAIKWGNIAILSFNTLITPLASSMFAPGVPLVQKEFDSNKDTLATFVVSVYILGFAVGPLFIAPMSECVNETLRCLHWLTPSGCTVDCHCMPSPTFCSSSSASPAR